MSEKLPHFKIIKNPPDYFRLIILILVLAIFLALIYISYIFTVLRFEELSLLTIFSRSEKVILELNSPKNEYQVGDLINVKVLLKTRSSKTEGVDILLDYDPEYLGLLTADKQTKYFVQEPDGVRIDPLKYLDTQKSSFETFPYFSIQREEGLINFSALAKPQQKLQGNLEVGSLNFQANKKGETFLNFVFEKGKTDDTNVASEGKDILGSVKNLKIIIK